MIRTGWARSPQGREYLVPIPPIPDRDLVPRLNTRDRVIEAAIFVLNRAEIRRLMREHSRCQDRGWKFHQAAQRLVEAARDWRTR